MRLSIITEIKNKNLKKYLDENSKILENKNFTSVREVLNNSIVFSHSFRNEYLTITSLNDNRVLLFIDKFGGNNIRKISNRKIENINSL